jgi:hypothetical protein
MSTKRIGSHRSAARAAAVAAFTMALCLLWAPPARAGDPRPECARCHARVCADFQAAAGKHKEIACGDCHHGHPPETADPFPKCTDCHAAHAKEMAESDCGKCHRAHTPAAVTWEATVSSEWCRACHAAAFQELAAGSPKHRAISCAVCHRGKHKAVPACVDCHGRLHPAAILARFPKCGECHHSAHELNHWPEKPVEAAAPGGK